MADAQVPFALATYESHDAGPRLGLVVGDTLADLVDAVATVAGATTARSMPTDMRSFIEDWTEVQADVVGAAAGLSNGGAGARPLASVRLRAPIRDPWNLMAIKEDGLLRVRVDVYDEAHIVRSLSAVMTLRAGDVVLTGTPDGVGVARTPPVFLAAGDLVSITIDGIGTLETPMVSG